MVRRGSAVLLSLLFMLSGCVLKSEYQTKLTEIDGLRKNVAGLEDKQAAAEKSLAEEKQKNADLAKKLADLEQAKAALEKEKAALQQENNNIKSTLESKRDQLSKEVVDLKNRLNENTARIASLEQELAGKNKHILELKEMVDQLTKEKNVAIEEKEKAVSQVKGTYDSLVSELRQEIKQGEVQITQLKDKLTVNMVEKILFDSGSAVIKKEGKKVLDRVADILKTLKNQQIRVEGHTDNVPISSRLADKFPSNWELSTARATTVVRYLQARGVDPGVLGAEGYGEYQPVAPNDTDENKAKNRRIEIVLLPIRSEK